MSREQHSLLAQLARHGLYTPPEATTRPRNGAGTHTPLPAPGDPQAQRYAAAALASEADVVATTPEGQRNDALNKAAFRMAQLIGNGWLAEATAFHALVDAGQRAGLSEAEAVRTVQSGLDGGRYSSRDGVELRQQIAPAYTLTVPTELSGGANSQGSNDMGEPEGAADHAEHPRQLVDGGAFIHQAPDQVPALWGDDDDVLWAEGEPLILTGPTGIGKTTLGTMIIAGRLGLLTDILGYPITAGHQRTLVFAMDRPAQIQRAMARLLRAWPQDVLSERLTIWKGPPPMDLARHPQLLCALAQEAGADTVVIDSLKDAAMKLSDEETGQGLSRAMNFCVSNGIEVLAYHHQKKASSTGQGRPNTLADVYGSSWITAGAGSVIGLWGNAGDLVVEMTHLKQPAGVVGPLQLGFDHTAGRAFLYEGMGDDDKILDLLSSGPQTPATIASWTSQGTPTRADVARVRRRMDRLAKAGKIVIIDAEVRRGGAPGASRGGSEGVKFALVESSNQSQSVQFLNHALNHGSGSLNHAEPDIPRSEAVIQNPRSTHALNHGSGSLNHAEPQNPRSNESRFESRPSTRLSHAPPPPSKGGEGRVATPGGLAPGDVEVCGRCHQEAERFIPGPGSIRLCPGCAYPTERHHRHEED